MLIEGQFRLNAPIQQVWDFLLEPGTLASWPISVRLKFTTVLTEVDPPTHVKATGKGADLGKAGNFTHEIEVNLAEISKDEVEISYKANISIVGRLATFGERIMRAKAKSVGEEFTKNLQDKLKSIAGS
jgi:carbon monoxide dehydrogenase subunit G